MQYNFNLYEYIYVLFCTIYSYTQYAMCMCTVVEKCVPITAERGGGGGQMCEIGGSVWGGVTGG